jgi:hypothetical protein
MQLPMIRPSSTISRTARIVVRSDRWHSLTPSSHITGRGAGSLLRVFVRLEPYAGKLARTVLRGG